jgi:two-component system, response regulator PdtaR
MAPTIAVLVVEDEALVRMDMAMQLSAEGFRVFEAANADEAIHILEKNAEIHILFTDIDMPGSMDGLKLSAFVRDRWPPIHIIVVSGHRIIDVVDLPDGGVFYSKPYDPTDVIRSMRELVSD